MYRTLAISTLLVAAIIAVACSGQSMETNDTSSGAVKNNVLLAEWTGPHGGVPAFDRMDLAVLEPVLESGMAIHLAEIDRITRCSPVT